MTSRISARIAAISTAFPSTCLDNAAIAALHPRFRAEKVEAKTGVARRYIAAPDECASDLAVAAAQKLFADSAVLPEQIDYLILCTQAPDYFLPTTACGVHQRLALRAGAGALDVNLGCSGFVYCLGLAAGLLVSGQANNVLVLTADTYSKFIDRDDIGTLSIFGDGAAATLVTAGGGEIGPFLYGTDGSGGPKLMVETGGLRRPAAGERYVDTQGRERAGTALHMHGPEIFNFTIGAVPHAVNDLLAAAALSAADIDLYVLHQANATMLDALRRKLEIPEERFWIDLADGGNTVSSTIPMALARALAAGKLRAGMKIMLVGFGVGYSWAATIVDWA
jgi:3-oxoacyl-[acyl-carrier-protein] synthase-3